MTPEGAAIRPLGVQHTLTALGVALLVNFGLALLLARTTPEPDAPPHLEAVVVPFVPEPPPPPESAPEDVAEAVAPAAIQPAPAAPSLSPAPIRLPTAAPPAPGALAPAALGPPATGRARRAAPAAPRAKDAGAVDEPPRPLTRRFPRYPADAESLGLEGAVTVRLLIDAQGRVSEAKVSRSNLPEIFEAAALAAIRTWRFVPARDAGVAVPVWAQQTLRFDLQ